MSTRIDQERPYFACVPDRLLADPRSAEGLILTVRDGQLRLNQTVASALAERPGHASEVSAPLLAPPLLCITGSGTPTASRGARLWR